MNLFSLQLFLCNSALKKTAESAARSMHRHQQRSANTRNAFGKTQLFSVDLFKPAVATSKARTQYYFLQ